MRLRPLGLIYITQTALALMESRRWRRGAARAPRRSGRSWTSVTDEGGAIRINGKSAGPFEPSPFRRAASNGNPGLPEEMAGSPTRSKSRDSLAEPPRNSPSSLLPCVESGVENGLRG